MNGYYKIVRVINMAASQNTKVPLNLIQLNSANFYFQKRRGCADNIYYLTEPNRINLHVCPLRSLTQTEAKGQRNWFSFCNLELLQRLLLQLRQARSFNEPIRIRANIKLLKCWLTERRSRREYFQLERIIDMQFVRAKPQHFLRWQNESPEHNVPYSRSSHLDLSCWVSSTNTVRYPYWAWHRYPIRGIVFYNSTMCSSSFSRGQKNEGRK